MKAGIIVLSGLLLLSVFVFFGCNSAEEVKPTQPVTTQKTTTTESEARTAENVIETTSAKIAETSEILTQSTGALETFTQAETSAEKADETTASETFTEPFINFSDLE